MNWPQETARIEQKLDITVAAIRCDVERHGAMLDEIRGDQKSQIKMLGDIKAGQSSNTAKIAAATATIAAILAALAASGITVPG